MPPLPPTRRRCVVSSFHAGEPMSHLSPKSPALPRTLLSLLLCGAALGTA
eukprot:gene57146-76311_t